MKLKNVVVNGIYWLGVVKTDEKGNVIAVAKALKVNANDRQAMVNYVKAKNSKNLRTVTLEGTANAVSVADLSVAATMEYKMLKMRMKAIKATALEQIENEQLDEGKFKLQ